MINHPVHISESNTISAFIPFCSVGFNVHLAGKEFSNFQVPVCSLFREKIYSGQVCYEADLNQYKKKLNWKKVLQEGLSLIIDTNDEFDVKNLLQRKSSPNHENRFGFNSFKQTEDNNKFVVMLKTISKILICSSELPLTGSNLYLISLAA